jgi:hypothetical protein
MNSVAEGSLAYADLRRHFKDAAAIFRKRDWKLYAVLAEGAADNEPLLELTSHVRPGQPGPHMLLAAVHFLVLDDPNSRLSAIFESPGDAEHAFPIFLEYCARRQDELRDILKTRTLQMTNADRAGYLMPAIAQVAGEVGEPLSLIEVGCSAGLLTIFDRYLYDYGSLGVIGDPAGARVAGCTFRGVQPVLPDRLPRIGYRVGLDLMPVDPTRAEERRWIVALTPPHLIETRTRLSDALEYRAAFDLRVIKGDALLLLPGILKEAPDPVCLFHSSCLYQWPIDARAAFSQLLLAASMTRVIHRISIEHRDFPMVFNGTVADRETAAIGATDADLVANIDMVVYRQGRTRTRRLGYYDGQGQMGRWVA